MSKIISILPVYRVEDREKSLEFFCQTLGMKILLEDGPLVYLGGHEKEEARLILEESPTRNGYSEAGKIKRHEQATIFAKASEIEQLLSNHFDNVSAFPTAENSFGFEVISPDRDAFRILPEGHQTIEGLVQRTDLSFKEEKESQLSDFSIGQISFNFPEDGDLYKSLDILKAQDFSWPKFSVTYTGTQAPNESKTWDLEALKFQLSNDVDFLSLRDKFSDFDSYLDARERVLMVELSEGIELWFEK